ncbi:peroxiredoxin [Clostridium perfringens]
MSIEINKLAPDFKLMGSDGKEHSLSDYKGKNIVLYFYPKDNTAGCTTEACDFRDNIQNFHDLNAIILGVSRDSLASHDKFITKLSLPFVLLSDPDEIVCKLYDVIKEKNMYGKKYMGVERSTFLINKEGILIEEFRKVRVKGHIEKVLDKLKEINEKIKLKEDLIKILF